MGSKAIKLVTPELRLSYCHLFTPRAMAEGGKAKYSVSILIPKNDTKTVKAINDAVAKCIAENPEKLKGKKGLKHPLRDGDEERESPEYADHYFLGASSTDKPVVLDESKQPILEPREAYSGMYGRVSINFFAYDTAGNKGVGAALNAVMKTADGEPLGSSYTEDDAVEDFGGTKDEDEDLL